MKGDQIMSNDIKFDPMTGEPIRQPAETPAPAAQETQTPAPETAAPTAQEAAQAAQAPAPKKGKTGKIIAGVVAAAAVVTGGVFGAKSLTDGGLGGGSPVDQFRTAVENTFVADEMTESVKAAGDMMEDGSYAVDAAIEAQGQEITVRVDTEKGKMSLDVGAKVSGMDVDGTLFVDDQKITADLNKPADIDPLSYDFTSDKSDKSDSYIVKLIGADNIKTIDSMLRMVQSMTGSQDKDKVQDTFYNKLEELDYDELEEKEFTVGGEKVSCGGYETTMTGEFIYDLMDAVYEEAYGKGISDMIDELANMGADVSDTEEFESTIKDMDEIDVKYYLNDGKFAMLNFATESDDGDVDVEIYFEGKDIPWHEMTIKNVESDQEVKLTTEDKDDELVYAIETDGEEQARLEYSKDDGSFKAISGDETVAEGKIKVEGDTVKVEIDEISGQDVSLSCDISDDADVKAAPEGAKDILDMSEADFTAIATQIMSKMYGL